MHSTALVPRPLSSPRCVCLVVALLLLLTVALRLSAQTIPSLEEGLRPYASLYGGDIDSVSLTNGNLVIHIPLVSFPQQGSLRLDFSVLANGKNWIVKPYQAFGAPPDPVQPSPPPPPPPCSPDVSDTGCTPPTNPETVQSGTTYTRAQWLWKGLGATVT